MIVRMPVPVLCCAGWYVQYGEIHVPRYEGLRQLGFYTCFLGGKSWGYLALRFAMLEGSSIRTPDSCNCNCIHTCSTNWPSIVQSSAVGVPSETRDISVSSGSLHLSSLPAHYTFPPLDFLLVSRAHAQSHVCLLAQGPGSVLLLPVSCHQPNSCYPYYSQYTATDHPKERSKIKTFYTFLQICLLYVRLLFSAETFSSASGGVWPAWRKSPLTSDSAHPKKYSTCLRLLSSASPKIHKKKHCCKHHNFWLV